MIFHCVSIIFQVPPYDFMPIECFLLFQDAEFFAYSGYLSINYVLPYILSRSVFFIFDFVL